MPSTSATSAPELQLIIAALVGITAIIVLITWLKLHPFVSLLVGGLLTGFIAGMNPALAAESFINGFGSTMSGVGVLIGLGAMYGKLLADSGGADRIVDALVSRTGPKLLPWMMGLVGAIIGLPMFFEVGLVLLVPVIILVARRSKQPLMQIALPTIAGLSAMHGLVPPHPGPLVAINALGANLGVTLAFGIIIAIPAVIVAGPLFSRLAARLAPVPVPSLFVETQQNSDSIGRNKPRFWVTLVSILLPVALMLAKAIADILAFDQKPIWKVQLDFLGTPVVALGIALIAGLFLLGATSGMGKKLIEKTLASSLPPVAGILLIVGAGGGFKQILVDTGIGKVIATFATGGSGMLVLLIAWFVAALIRVATGSATVATITAAGLLEPLAAQLSSPMVALMVLAIGSGSLFLSHVNDAGFWIVKEYLSLSVAQTLKTWTVLECLISITGLVGVLVASLFAAGLG